MAQYSPSALDQDSTCCSILCLVMKFYKYVESKRYTGEAQEVIKGCG